MTKKGILIHGPVKDETRNIINEYKKIFPNVDIVLSTWTKQNNKIPIIGIIPKRS